MENRDLPLMVTIRCITYNHEPYIRQCLEGFVIQKTNFHFEAIVHDDASTDDTAAIIREYAAKYPDIIKPIFETENQYSKHDGSLQRIMSEHTHGKYVAICEGDDYWTDPLKLQKQVDFLEENPQYGMCYMKVLRFYQSEGRLGEIYGGPSITFDDLLKENSIPTLTTMFRKSLFDTYEEQLSPYKNMWLMGDYPLWLWLSYNSLIAFIPEVSGVYRILEDSACHSKSFVKKAFFQINVYDIRFFFAKKYFNNHAQYFEYKIYLWKFIYSVMKRNEKDVKLYFNILLKNNKIFLKEKVLLYAGRYFPCIARKILRFYLK